MPRVPIAAGLVQPQSAPLMMARLSSARPAASKAAPGRSGKVRCPGARLSTSWPRAAHSAAAPNGRLIMNAQRQPPSSTSAPPIGGPSPAATAAVAPHRPIACARRSSENAAITRASDAGTSMAAPSAWTTRAATSSSTDGASAHSTEATVNTRTPLANARRRPTRSVSRPNTMRKAAKTMLYALRIQDRSPTDVPGNDSTIEGNATFTMVASRNARNAPAHDTSRTRPGATRALVDRGMATTFCGHAAERVSAQPVRPDQQV